MKYSGSTFIEDGRRCLVRDIGLMARADSYLHNDSLYVQADARGRVSAHFNQPEFTRYSEGLRCFYLRDETSGKFWSAPYDPVMAAPETCEFSAGLDDNCRAPGAVPASGDASMARNSRSKFAAAAGPHAPWLPSTGGRSPATSSRPNQPEAATA